jgi:hypothetical protein
LYYKGNGHALPAHALRRPRGVFQAPIFGFSRAIGVRASRDRYETHPEAADLDVRDDVEEQVVEKGRLAAELTVEKAQLELNAPASGRLKILAPAKAR